MSDSKSENEAKASSKKPRVVCDFRKENKNLNWSHYFAIFLWVGWFLTLPLLLASFPIMYMYCRPLFTVVFGLFVLSLIYPVDRRLQPKWGYKLGSWCMEKACAYFGLRLIQEDPEALKCSGPVISVLEPHDVLPVSIFALSDNLGYFPGHKMIGCLTGICFKTPFMKHIYTWAAASSVDKKNIVRLLNDKVSPCVCPGGAQEVTHLKDHKVYNLYLKSRYGLVKLAMKYGYPLVPTFAFGQRACYDFWVPQNKFLHRLGRMVGFIPLFFTGVWGIPMGPPKPIPITVVSGTPIPVPKIDNPTQEQLDEYQTKLNSEIVRIFDTYKGDCGMADCTVNIL